MHTKIDRYIMVFDTIVHKSSYALTPTPKRNTNIAPTDNIDGYILQHIGENILSHALTLFLAL